MAEASKSLGSVQFGPFELLLDTEELRKYGLPVKLSGQAIQILIVLASRPGQLVTREELQRKLWPGDSFGDFEHGLNAAVNKLREKLGDSATTPTYIETLPGRGYRFIFPLEHPGTLPEPEPPQPESPRPPWWRRRATIHRLKRDGESRRYAAASSITLKPEAEGSRHQIAPAARNKNTLSRSVITAVVVVVALVAVWLYYRRFSIFNTRSPISARKYRL